MTIRLILLATLLVTTLSNGALAIVHESLSRLASPGPLAAQHAKLDGDCIKCHTAGGGVTDRLCLDCHKQLRARIEQDKGYHAKREKKCFACHPDHQGRQFDMIPRELLKPEVFRHQVTGFPLEGAHVALKCDSCHRERSYLKLKADCDFCHQDPHERQFAAAPCDDCHSASGNWLPDRFKHERAKFKLEGAHREADCGDCHGDGRFRGRAAQGCADCHDGPHEGQFAATPCGDCHSVSGNWFPDRFKHERAKFKLEGAHREADCSDCHGDGRFRGRAAQGCVDCHIDPHAGLRDRDCTRCHNPLLDWDLELSAHQEGPFPLEGRHARLACSECHRGGEISRLDSNCTACHRDPHRNQFGNRSCRDCHTPTGWLPPTFRHIGAGFILDGRHRAINCQACHPGRNYRNTPIDCESCHNDDFRRSRNPSHINAGIRGDCRLCHNTSAWRGAIFNHSFYLLSGPHNNAMRCNSCHVGGARYRLSDSRCSVCHPRPLHPGHPHPDGDMPDHTVPHLHGHEPCGKCHYTDIWQNIRFHSMGGN